LEARPDESNITVIDACENLGFAKANNVGMEFAVRDPEARHFWILNNDTVVRPDALQILERYAGQHPASGIIGTTLLYYDRPEIVQGYGGWMTPSKALAGHIGYGMQADISPSKEQIEENLAYIMGASMFVSREAFRSTGGMSENYFLYFEEADWARRLPRTLQQSVCVDAVVYHKEGGSIGTSSSSRSSDTSLYYLTVNSLRFYWAFERKFIGIMAARIVWNELRHIKHGDWAAVRVALTAGRDFVLGRRRRGRYGSAEFNAKSYAFDEDP
jgi:GT2 family glycosyltransferase